VVWTTGSAGSALTIARVSKPVASSTQLRYAWHGRQLTETRANDLE
jgi:hypothetical protein